MSIGGATMSNRKGRCRIRGAMSNRKIDQHRRHTKEQQCYVFESCGLFMFGGGRVDRLVGGLDTGDKGALILGGGQGLRLFPLTKDRAKPAVPLAGKYVSMCRLVLASIHTSAKFSCLPRLNSESLHRHIHSSFKFDIFSESFVELLRPSRRQGRTYQGTADSVAATCGT